MCVPARKAANDTKEGHGDEKVEEGHAKLLAKEPANQEVSVGCKSSGESAPYFSETKGRREGLRASIAKIPPLKLLEAAQSPEFRKERFGGPAKRRDS